MGKFSSAIGEFFTESSTRAPDNFYYNNSTTSSWADSLNVSRTNGNIKYYQNGQVIFLIILFVTIVVSNLAVLLAILASKRNNKMSRMNFFIMNLALADLFVALVSVLTDLIWRITLQWYAGDVMCKLVRYLQVVVTYASTYVLVALSLDRLDAIARPMNFLNGDFRARLLVGSAWLLAFLLSTPMLIINQETKKGDTNQCRITLFDQKWKWQVYISLIAAALFIIPAIIITGCYVIIIYVIWKKSKPIRQSSNRSAVPTDSKRFIFRHKQQSHQSTNSGEVSNPSNTNSLSVDEAAGSSSRGVIPKAKIRTIKMTFVIVLVFILCWSPYFVFDLLDVYDLIPKGPHRTSASIFIQSLAPLNSVANPIIYGLFTSKIFQNFGRTSCCRQWLQRLHCFQSVETAGKLERDNSMSLIPTIQSDATHSSSCFRLQDFKASSSKIR